MSTPEFHAAPAAAAGPAAAAVPAHLRASRTAKVLDCHLDRKAIVYVRQSSPQQVAEHKESAARLAAGAGGDSGSAGAGHGDSPVSSLRRAWHHCASLSNAATLILGGPPPGIQAVA